MSTITRLKTWISGDTLTHSDLNNEFNNIINDYNGGISNVNIASNAAIPYSKLNLSGNVLNNDIASNAAITYSKLNLSGGIINSDISGSAAIAVSKIANTGMDLSTAQVASNKTFTKPIINGSVGAFTTDSDGTTVTFDMSASNTHTVTISGNRSFVVTNVSVGQSFIIFVQQDGSGSRLVTWFSSIKWQTGSAPTLTTTAAKVDAFGFYCYSSGNYYGFIVGQNL